MQEIIIIDDDEVIVFLHEIILSEYVSVGTSIRTYNYATDALMYLNTIETEKKILILLDLNMPEVSGWDFLNELNKNSTNENIYIIIVTSSIDINEKIKAKNYKQVLQFMEKPLLIEKIMEWKKIEQLDNFFQ